MTDVDDHGPQPASPLWRAWQSANRASWLLAAGAVVLLAVVAVALLGGGDDDEPVRRTTTAAASAAPTTSPLPSVTPSRRPSPAPTTAPSGTPSAAPTATPSTAAPPPAPPSPTPSASPDGRPTLVLGGDDLGVTRVGAPDTEAVRALTAALGPPVADPAPATACVGAGDREVEWADFRLAITDGRVSGWRSTDGRLSTPSGVTVGTTVTELQEAYGDGLELYDASPDSGPGFAVADVQLAGALTGEGADDRVTSFHNRACSPP